MVNRSTLDILDGDEVARLGPYRELVDALEAGHRAPPAVTRRVVFGPGGGEDGADADERFLTLSAWRPGDLIATKLATVFPDNPHATGLPAVQAVVVLFDGTTGSPLALIDGTELTYRKTAADSALGSRLCSRPDSTTLLMVGAGGLAPHLVAAHRAVRPAIERVLVWNRSPARADALVADGVADARVVDLDSAVSEADIVCTATMTGDPLVHGAALCPGTHVDCVGSYLPDRREVDDEVVRRARILVDARETTVVETGDLAIPIANGTITADAVRGDLYQLCRGEVAGRTDDGEITLFANGGGGHLDLMTARYLWGRRHG